MEMWSSSEPISYREPRKNLLKINFLLLWAIFLYFLTGLSIFVLFIYKWPEVQHTTSKMMFLTFITELEKSDTEAIVPKRSSK